MSGVSENSENQQIRLESKKYHFLAIGSMPVIDIEIATGDAENPERQRLIIEVYNPRSGEVFEAKFNRGRVEVDRDGTITYFTTSSDKVSFSLFLERNLRVSMNKQGEVEIRTPSKILRVTEDIKSRKPVTPGEVSSDSITLKLE